jgi:hypothetical protein
MRQASSGKAEIRLTLNRHRKSPAKVGLGSRRIQEGPETIADLGASVPTGTLTVFPGCAGLLIGFAHTLFDEKVLESS